MDGKSLLKSGKFYSQEMKSAESWLRYYTSRFHGSNNENWLKKGIEPSLRYAYLYCDSELKQFIPALAQHSRRSKHTYAIFNNCHGGFAVKMPCGLHN